MTDKEQIIIDGVDVSGCIHIDEWKHCNCCNDLIKTVYPNATKCHTENDLRCEIYPNCNFKQLARKTQECESLKQEIEILQNNYDTATRDCNEEIARLEQECEELKKELDKTHSLMLEKQNKAVKYFSILNDIEEYLKLPTNVCLTDCPEYSIGQGCSQKCFENRLKILYDIINKAKGGNNV